MRALVISDSQFGNTSRIARAIARGLRACGWEADDAPATDWNAHVRSGSAFDLILVGGPTVSRRMTAPLASCVDDLAAHVAGRAVGAFDTRYRGSELIMGSAARKAARLLERGGGRLVAPKESFFVVRAEGPMGQHVRPGFSTLADGEESRAEAWGRQLAERMVAATRALAAVDA